MAKIAYILLCHKDPEAVVRQAEGLTAAGDYIAIHFDASAKASEYKQIHDALQANPNVVFAKRVKCGWGEWSLVQGSLNAMIAAEAAFPEATHFYMVSGDCMAIKPASYAHRFLDENDKDFVEHNDFFESDWIKTGMKEDRLFYRHWFNERSHKTLFYNSYRLQKFLKIRRSVPVDLEIKIGSQWWCLRRRTVEAILKFIRERPDIIRFFSTTWIPDETFFQTLALHLVPKDEVVNRTLTFLIFSDYGMPATFFNDQYEFLLAQDSLFARKISSQALELKEMLSKLYAGGDVDLNITDEGRKLYHFLTQRGRFGRRFATRFWEQESSIGREREVLVLMCKKWHVAKRFLEVAEYLTGITGVAYLFNELDTPMPNLGGIENSLSKRLKHRRAVMRLIYDHNDTDRMIICADTGDIDLLDDFYADHCTTRVLEISCTFDEEYLIGHAIRTGLAGENSSADTLKRIVPPIRMDFAYERNQVRDRNYPNFFSISDRHDPKTNTAQIAAFLEIPEDTARQIAQTPHLFAD
ncbi:MAG: beta-1,6-N-acetylglucosaminyltransferase [Rhodobacteraceae bacterium]|nr:beta-1,6-N-acetylglucosaminyltransferase [Paracoccaceae bacterium]